MTAALCCAYYLGSSHVDPTFGASIVGVAAVAIFGVARLTRWTFHQLQTIANVRTQAESVRLLLKEYEHRGVGWLWQVDAENRVVYISSRMTSLLGRSANQLIGHSLPATLGGNSALGRTLLARAPFASLEMELKTRRGTRWISLAGDPIIDMAGQFQGFRGVGSDVTEVRKTQERLTNLANMDVLSGLPNRGRVRQLLGEALSGSSGAETPCAIMFLDLDGFKPVNDTFGHPKGDAVLKSVRTPRQKGDSGHAVGWAATVAIVSRDEQRRKVGTRRRIISGRRAHHIARPRLRIDLVGAPSPDDARASTSIQRPTSRSTPPRARARTCAISAKCGRGQGRLRREQISGRPQLKQSDDYQPGSTQTPELWLEALIVASPDRGWSRGR